MIRSVTEAANLTIFTQIGLVMFVVTFTAIIMYALTRSRRSVTGHARMPIEDARRAATLPTETRSER